MIFSKKTVQDSYTESCTVFFMVNFLQRCLNARCSYYCKDRADSRAAEIYDKLIFPVDFFSVFVGEGEDRKPNAAENRAHCVHAEACAVKRQREKRNCGEPTAPTIRA